MDKKDIPAVNPQAPETAQRQQVTQEQMAASGQPQKSLMSKLLPAIIIVIIATAAIVVFVYADDEKTEEKTSDTQQQSSVVEQQPLDREEVVANWSAPEAFDLVREDDTTARIELNNSEYTQESLVHTADYTFSEDTSDTFGMYRFSTTLGVDTDSDSLSDEDVVFLMDRISPETSQRVSFINETAKQLVGTNFGYSVARISVQTVTDEGTDNQKFQSWLILVDSKQEISIAYLLESDQKNTSNIELLTYLSDQLSLIN